MLKNKTRANPQIKNHKKKKKAINSDWPDHIHTT